MNNIHTISGLREIYSDYDIFILDQWGVMHDGYQAYKNAIECVNELFNKNKKLVIISNSSKKNSITKLSLPKMGFNENSFFNIMTSGEMIWQSIILEKNDEINNLGKNCFYIHDDTQEESKNFIIGLEKFKFVKNIEEADFILGCTPFSKSKIIDFIPTLEIAKRKDLPFICANPDFETVDKNSNKMIFCMGSIAELYKNIGGKVFILGKPSKEIYQETLKDIPNIDKSRILGIGDSLHHDIKGAINYGIDSLLITSTGIHQNLFDEKKPIWHNNDHNLEKFTTKPRFICSDFKF